MNEKIKCELEVIRGEHGNPLLLVKFDKANNFFKKEYTDSNGNTIPAFTWVPTLDEMRLISDTLYLLNSMVTHLDKKKIYTEPSFEIGHD